MHKQEVHVGINMAVPGGSHGSLQKPDHSRPYSFVLYNKTSHSTVWLRLCVQAPTSALHAVSFLHVQALNPILSAAGGRSCRALGWHRCAGLQLKCWFVRS